MGIPDSALLDFVAKVRSWIDWRPSDLTFLSGGFEMAGKDFKTCGECRVNSVESCLMYHCETCARVLCENCVQNYGSIDVATSDDHESRMEAVINIQCCQFCDGLSTQPKGMRKNCDKVHPSDSPRQCHPHEAELPALGAEKLDAYSPHAVSKSSVASFSSHPSMFSFHGSPNRSDEEEEENSTSNFFSASSEYYNDTSDVETSSISTRTEFYSFKSVGSSPSNSPSRIHITSNRVGHPVQLGHQGTSRSPNDGSFVQESMAILKKPGIGTEMTNCDTDSADDMNLFGDQKEKPLEPLDFENNGLIWFPPPPDVEDDDAENSFFTYDDDDDDIGDPCTPFNRIDSFASEFPMKEKHNGEQNKPLKTVIHGHFRALVAQLLQGEGIRIDKDDSSEDWLDIITSIAWQAANYVKPDTSKGGSMDPCDYVKIKCLALGSPSESTLIRGVVCTKNIKHKRMTSQYKNAKLLLLGGALEYQRLNNQLASFDTLLEQETDQIKMIISKIEAHHPNVLLVEKTVSSRAQEYLLAKDISLVLNVKRPLLERIARCTGALITPSIDKLSTTRIGHCELFRLERLSEEHEFVNQVNKKPSKTLMYFEGCPRRLGCTVLLKGSCHEELKKVKHVVQYALFAAYHLSLETSFLSDEGASLPTVTLNDSVVLPDRVTAGRSISLISASDVAGNCEEVSDVVNVDIRSSFINVDSGLQNSLSECYAIASMSEECISRLLCSAEVENLADNHGEPMLGADNRMKDDVHEVSEEDDSKQKQQGDPSDLRVMERLENVETSTEFCPTDSHQSILVSFSSRCVLSGTVCERSRLLRIKYYGCFDKPLGRYLQDDLFDQASCCRSCKEPSEAHVICYTHPQGNLTINVKRLPSLILPGERDGKIWMWHRCLRCSPSGGVPPATRRVVMSDAAWGLSFGKFLELSFSNHATANRVASCGHSLQRECLRFYGWGSMIAFFRYSPVDIHSVSLPPSVLEFTGLAKHDWIRKEAMELSRKVELMYTEILSILHCIEEKCTSCGSGVCGSNVLMKHILELYDLLVKERNEYSDLLWSENDGKSDPGQETIDILELNSMMRSLVKASRDWYHRLLELDSLFESCASSKASNDAPSSVGMQECSSDASLQYESLERVHEEIMREDSRLHGGPGDDLQPEDTNSLNNMPDVQEDSSTSYEFNVKDGNHVSGENMLKQTPLERAPSAASVLSDKIDSAWTGAEQPPEKAQLSRSLLGERSEASKQIDETENPILRKFVSPDRVYSFDSAVRFQERLKKGIPPSSLHLSTLKSFHASGDYKSMVRDPVSYLQRAYSQMSASDAQKTNVSSSNFSSFISSISLIPKGARLMVPQSRKNNIVIAVYDNEPTSIISYVIASKEHEDFIADKQTSPDRGYNRSPVASNISGWQSFGSLDLDYMQYGSYGDASNTISFFTDPKSSPHLKVSFEDESFAAEGRVKFFVTCYFAKQFDALRQGCCPKEVDFLCSLIRCRRWSAQGGKSNVYFAKSMDDRFIIKQVTRTELESFEEFAPEYFKYLTDSLSSGSPTCLAKILGIYQVAVKNLKSGKETKMDLMVMENLFYGKNISRVYDLKGSVRSRYNSDTTGRNKVLLDMNLLETLCTKPIFLGSKAKRRLERAVWNDTSFLASVDVMDYSLLVGVDEERKELVLGIIDFMRQYTWDKHLETWVKASGILGGPKNASPTIISPKQYKKRFRKAMTTYFLTVPDQWSS